MSKKKKAGRKEPFSCRHDGVKTKSGSCVRCVVCALQYLDAPAASDSTFAPGGVVEAAKALVCTTVVGGRYVIRRPICAGAMGRVYEGYDLDWSRAVVLKFMHPLLALDPDARARFGREQAVQVGLWHPNLLPALDAGDDPAVGPYLVQPLVTGETLKDRLEARSAADKPLSPLEAAQILRDIAAALAALDERGVVHRDAKPANVLLPLGGYPAAVLIDYGVVAVAVPDGERLTAVGTAVGTPAYMSPEQAAGAPLDGRSDLFALGLMGWQALGGSNPRPAVVGVPGQPPCGPPPVCALRPDVPQPLSDLIDELMQVDPVCRPQSAAEVVRRLNRILHQLEN